MPVDAVFSLGTGLFFLLLSLPFFADVAARIASWLSPPPTIRRFLMYFKKMTEEYFKDLIVVSYNEIESNVELQSVGMVTA